MMTTSCPCKHASIWLNQNTMKTMLVASFWFCFVAGMFTTAVIEYGIHGNIICPWKLIIWNVMCPDNYIEAFSWQSQLLIHLSLEMWVSANAWVCSHLYWRYLSLMSVGCSTTRHVVGWEKKRVSHDPSLTHMTHPQVTWPIHSALNRAIWTRNRTESSSCLL